MTFRIVSAVLAAAICLFLSVYVLSTTSTNRTKKIFAYSNLSLALWNIGDLLVVLSFNYYYSIALFFDRLSYFGALLVVTFFVQFISFYLSDWKSIPIKIYNLIQRIRMGFLMMSLPMGIIIWTPWVIKEVQWPPLVEVPGSLFPFFAVFFVCGILYVAASMVYGFKTATGLRRTQLKYFALAMFLGTIGAAIFFITILNPAFPPIYYYFEIAYVLIIFYAIVKYRLMDISVVIHKGLAYGLFLGAIFVPAYLFVIISQRAAFYSIPPFLAGTLIFACGLWVVLKNPRASPNVTFSLICLGVCVWLFGSFIMYSETNPEQALLWAKLIMMGVVFIPAFFYHFCASFLQQQEVKRKLILTNYLVGTVFLLLIPTHYLLNGVHSYFWGFYDKAGVLHPVFLGYFALVSGLGLRNLYLEYKAKERVDLLVEATRIKYVFWSSLIGFSASTDFVQSYGFELYPTGFLFVSLWVMIVTYAIVKHQLLDISVTITKIKVLRYIQALALIPIYLFILMLIQAFTDSMQYLLAGVLVATFTILAGVLVNLQKRMERVVGKALFPKKYNAYETLTGFSKAIVAILDINALNEKIIITLLKVMGITKITLFLFNKEKDAYSLAASYGMDQERLRQIKIQGKDPFPQYLIETNQLLLREELEHDRRNSPGKDLKWIVDFLSLIESELCIPLMNKERLVGFLNLGYKAHREMFSQEDLNLLSTLGQSAAIALDNALLYEDLKQHKSLMRRTDRLRSLETIAGGFAHEIRNPLTSIKTFIQLAPERKDDPEFIGSFSKVVSEDVYRIERLIQEILHYARYTEPKFAEEDLNEVVESSLYFVGVKAGSRAITIEKDLVGDLPTIWMDRQQIKQVLMNLFLNALDAIPNGERLFVKTHKLVKTHGERWVQIEIRDTGCGISEEDLEHIFDPFFTTKHESEEREGTGLGLTIVHQIVQEHRGYIEVESKPGVGTTFYVNLPANPVMHDRRK